MLSYDKDIGCKLKFYQEIQSKNFREFTCFYNIYDKYLVMGTEQGFLEVYRNYD